MMQNSDDGCQDQGSGDDEYLYLYEEHYGEYAGPVRPGYAERCYPEGAASRTPGTPLRVIHASWAMLPAGIDRWLAALIRSSDPRRIKFLRCVVLGGYVDWKQLARVGVPVEVGGRDSMRRASDDCDVLLISDPGGAPDWVDGVSAKLCVAVAHGDGVWTRQRLEYLAPVVDHVVAVSPRAQRAVCHGFPSTVIPNGVDPLHLARCRSRNEVRASLGFRPGDFVLGYVGRFSHEKRPFALLEAAARLPHHFKVLLVGFGPLREELLARANDLIPCRHAIVRGEDHMGDLYAAMDAFCMVSHSEGYGLAIMEAMMCGKPVIVSDVGCVPDVIVDRVNGIVVAGDAESICNAAARLDTHHDWAAALGREAFRSAEEYGYASKMAERYAALLEQLWTARSSDEPPLDLTDR